MCIRDRLLALAGGAKTEKMKFGHHGANHPVQSLTSKEVFITSQNHGFVISEETLPESATITHRSLFDGSIEGFEIAEKNILSGEPIPVFNDGDMQRDFTYIDDIVAGVIACLNKPPISNENAPLHRIYNIGNNHSASRCCKWTVRVKHLTSDWCLSQRG